MDDEMAILVLWPIEKGDIERGGQRGGRCGTVGERFCFLNGTDDRCCRLSADDGGGQACFFR